MEDYEITVCLCCPFKLFEPDHQFWRCFVRKLCNNSTQTRMHKSSTLNKTNMRTQEIVRRNRKQHNLLQDSQITFYVIKLLLRNFFYQNIKHQHGSRAKYFFLFFCLMLKTNKPFEPGLFISLQKHVNRHAYTLPIITNMKKVRSAGL